MKIEITYVNLQGKSFEGKSVIRLDYEAVSWMNQEAAENIIRSLAHGFGEGRGLEVAQIQITTLSPMPDEGLSAVVTMQPKTYNDETIGMATVLSELAMELAESARNAEPDIFAKRMELYGKARVLAKKYGL